MINDNTGLILFRLVVFASLPMISAVLALMAMRRPVDRDTLQPLFYGQCFVTTPVVMLFSIAEAITRLPQSAADIPAGILFVAASLFYVGAEAGWFAHEAQRSRLIGLAWSISAFAVSVLVLSGIAFLFSGKSAAL